MPARTPPPNLPDLDGLTLLVLHADSETVGVLATFLRACGATVLAAVTVAGALAYTDEARKLDAVVADLAMAGGDGADLARNLRRNPMRSRLPIVGLTGRHTDHRGPQAFDAVVLKPVDLDDLAFTIASLTRR